MAQPVRALVDGVDEFIGIDHHKKRRQVMVKDRQGHVLRRGNIPTRREALEGFLGERNGAVRMAVFEAGPGPLRRGGQAPADAQAGKQVAAVGVGGGGGAGHAVEPGPEEPL